MARAYRPFDRVHAPLVSPLEDLNPATAHLKPQWASSFQRLQECLISSLFDEGRDYSVNLPSTKNSNRYHWDELLVFNVYKTLHLSTAYGLGPNPCSPFYIFYSGRHPADRLIQSSPAEPPSPSAVKFNSLSKKIWRNLKGLGGPASDPHNSATKSSNALEWSSDDMSQQSKGAPIRPNLIQSFLDRKDFSTRQSSTVACIRFYEEFIEWRLLPPISEKFSKSGAGVFSSGGSRGKGEKEKHIYLAPIAYPLPRSITFDGSDSTNNSFKKTISISNLKQRARGGSPPTSPTSTQSEPCTPQKREMKKVPTNTPRDIPAARIYLNPTLHCITPSSGPGRSLTEFFTGKDGGEGGRDPIYTTLEELGSVESQPINVFFSDTGPGTKTYWWVSEDSSWRIVYDKTQDINISSKRHCLVPLTTTTATATTTSTTTPLNQHESKASLDSSSHNYIFGKPKVEEKVTKMFPEVKGGCVKLYIANSDEPVAQVHLLTGQMWILKYLMLETIDIAMTVIFSVVNLERHIEDEHEAHKKRPSRFSGGHASN